MTTLSIVLPGPLVKASQNAAHHLGVSRTQFIKQAIVHELQKMQALPTEIELAKAMAIMKQDQNYLEESEEIEAGLNSVLPKEKDQWWTGKKKS